MADKGVHNVSRLSSQYPSAKFIKLDIDEVPEVASQLGVRAMPTFILFRDGKKIDEVVGADQEKLDSAVKAAVEG
ncbi:Cytoplasmic thioredoxin isoenzyme 2 [Toensbergia leucococca]|nr:Cytoplasmic thioredoxin isoenzyme 2 [Toensbergia leucococca]